MSTLKVGTIQNTSGGASSPPEQIEQGRIKLWGTFKGDGTVAIFDSFNVSSIGDYGTGDYTINFSITFANTNFCLTGSATEDTDGGPGNRGQFILSPTRDVYNTNSCRVHTMNCTNGNLFNCGRFEIHIAGDV